MATDMQDINLMDLMEHFHSDEDCRDLLEDLRWPDGVCCPRCDSDKISRMYTRNQFDCDSCGYQFSVTSGTMLHDTHLPLSKWFVATYLITESKKGVSANQIKRVIGVSYKTAWYLCHRIRAAMKEVRPEPLTGTVEVDETWVGGKQKGVGRGHKGNKTINVGAIERGGQVRAQVIESVDRKTLHRFIHSATAEDAEAIYTDDWPAYDGVANGHTRHETVKHSAEEWVRKGAHTNTIENVWSLLKRSIIGSYHKISAKHLDAYLDELEWRFNNRENPYLFRDTLLKLINSTNLTYRRLTTYANGYTP